MAQYLKAFPRSKTFPGQPVDTSLTSAYQDHANVTAGVSTVVDSAGERRTVVVSDSDADARGGRSDGNANASSDAALVGDVSRDSEQLFRRPPHPRLMRRAKAIERELLQANAIDRVSELGKTLFGLDILET